jgi:hypothetical protein
VRHLNLRLSARLALLVPYAALGCMALAIFSSASRAHDVKPAEQPPCSCPSTAPNAHLDEDDEIATLEAIRVALTEVGDGGTYVWYREHGRLNGMIRPTVSFKDVAGRVCRHITIMLTVGTATGRAEGVACRLPDGRWQLDG